MKILRTPEEFPTGSRKVCLAIGVFDGVHLGHQQVIRQTLGDASKQGALAVVLTFDRHPATVLAPERAPRLIYSIAHKLKVIGELGVDAAVVMTFDRSFSEIPAEEFIQRLARAWSIQSLCVGSGFTFGHQRFGNVSLLHELGMKYGFLVHALSALALDEEKVSSTRIRKKIGAGALEEAGEMLGRPYSILGPVIRGQQLGRQLGFPTANLGIEGILLPPSGVYLSQARAGSSLHRALVNIGSRPTLSSGTPQLSVEAHLLDYQGDLYDQEIELVFGEKLREEQKFPSIDDLKAQIRRDIAVALTRF